MNDSRPSVGQKPINEPENIAALLADRVQKAPEKVFLFSEADDRQFSYARFAAAVKRPPRCCKHMVSRRATSSVF